MPNFLIYGANGYTGNLIANEAKARGLHPILAGRNAPALSNLAKNLGFEARIFGLEKPDEVNHGLAGIKAILNCAGPFTRTAKSLAEACLQSRVHYLDITGEAGVFEALAAQDKEAREAGVMLLPGVGFDVVPSDCLAAHLKRRLPSACRLALGFLSGGQTSRGTALTIVENLDGGGLVRKGGILTPVPLAWKTRVIDFGTGPMKAITIPWGDVVTAFYSTGIPDIEVYMAAPLGLRIGAKVGRYLGWLLGSSIMQRFLKRRIMAGPAGPSDAERKQGQSYLWGEVENAAGEKATARLRGPEAYTMTALTALAVVERVLAGEAPPGFQTPAKAYGADFILGIPGLVRED